MASLWAMRFPSCWTSSYIFGRNSGRSLQQPSLIRLLLREQGISAPQNGLRWSSTTAAAAVHQSRGRTYFSEEEDAIILTLREERKSWKVIHEALPHRSPESLRGRWERHVRPDLDFKKERLSLPYTPADFETIKRLREQGVPWAEIQAHHFPERSQANLRYYFHITQPSFGSDNEDGKSPWSVEEDRLLLRLRGERALSWTQIHSYLPGRSTAALHIRYFRLRNRMLNRERGAKLDVIKSNVS